MKQFTVTEIMFSYCCDANHFILIIINDPLVCN